MRNASVSNVSSKEAFPSSLSSVPSSAVTSSLAWLSASFVDEVDVFFFFSFFAFVAFGGP